MFLRLVSYVDSPAFLYLLSVNELQEATIRTMVSKFVYMVSIFARHLATYCLAPTITTSWICPPTMLCVCYQSAKELAVLIGGNGSICGH